MSIGLTASLVAGSLMSSPAQEPRPTPVWRTRTEAVWVFATVTNQDGQPVADLPQDAFRVFDDGAEQKITQFGADRSPVSVGLVVDVSESMRGRRINVARSALASFLNELAIEDEVFLLSFNHASRVDVGWMPPGSLHEPLANVQPSGGTAIYDAVRSALPELARRKHQRSALVVISDGADTASDTSLFDLRSDLRQSDAFVYALAIAGPNDRPSTRVNPEALRAFTDETGGYTAVISDVAELQRETARIAQELNHQYLIGYLAPRPADDKFHTIRVRAKDETYRVRARRGYLATK
ncbi:MAG: VWA domain-containing protein [Vicinamibacterales bacterium]